MKEKGNNFFKEKLYQKALKSYNSGIDSIKMLPKTIKKETTQEQFQHAEPILLPLYLNKALVLIKTEKWLDVLLTTKLIFQMDPENLKALYYRGLANLRMKYWTDATVDLKLLVKREPQDAVFRGLYEEALAGFKVAQTKIKNKFVNMFEQMKNMEDKQILKEKKQEKLLLKQQRLLEESKNKKFNFDSDSSQEDSQPFSEVDIKKKFDDLIQGIDIDLNEQPNLLTLLSSK